MSFKVPNIPIRYVTSADKSIIKASESNTLNCNPAECCLRSTLNSLQDKFTDVVFSNLSPQGQQAVNDVRTNLAQFLAHTNRLSGVRNDSLVVAANNLPDWLAFKLKTYDSVPFAAVFNDIHATTTNPLTSADSKFSAILTASIGSDGKVFALQSPGTIFNPNYPVVYVPSGLYGQSIKAEITSLDSGGKPLTLNVSDIGGDILSSYILTVKIDDNDCSPLKFKNIEVAINTSREIASVVSLPTECAIDAFNPSSHVGSSAELLNLGGQGIGFRGSVNGTGIQISDPGRNYVPQTYMSIKKPFAHKTNSHDIDIMPEYKVNNTVSYDFCIRDNVASGFDISSPVVSIPCGNEIACFDALTGVVGVDATLGFRDLADITGSYNTDGSIDFVTSNQGHCYKQIDTLKTLPELLKTLTDYSQIKDLTVGISPVDTAPNQQILFGQPDLEVPTDCASFCVQERLDQNNIYALKVITTFPFLLTSGDVLIGDSSNAYAKVASPAFLNVGSNYYVLVASIHGQFAFNETLSLQNKKNAWAFLVASGGRYQNGSLIDTIDITTISQDDKKRLLCCLECGQDAAVLDPQRIIYDGIPFDGRNLDTIKNSNGRSVKLDPDNILDANLFNIVIPNNNVNVQYRKFDNTIPLLTFYVSNTDKNYLLDKYNIRVDDNIIAPDIVNIIAQYQQKSLVVATATNSTIHFNNNTIVDVSGSLDVFKPNQLVKIVGGPNNGIVVTIKSVTPTSIGLDDRDSVSNTVAGTTITLTALGIYTGNRIRFDSVQSMIVDFSGQLVKRGFAIGQKVQVLGGLNTGYIFTVTDVTYNALKIKSENGYSMIPEVEGNSVSLVYIPTVPPPATPESISLNNKLEFVACAFTEQIPTDIEFSGSSSSFIPDNTCNVPDPCVTSLVVINPNNPPFPSSSSTTTSPSPTICNSPYIKNTNILFDDTGALRLPTTNDVFTALFGSLLNSSDVCSECQAAINNASPLPSGFDCNVFDACISKLCQNMSSDNYYADLFTKAVGIYEIANVVKCSSLHQFFLQEISCANGTNPSSSSASCTVLQFKADDLMSSSSASREEFVCPP